MRGILQHQISGLFLAEDGTLTGEIAMAEWFPNLAKAVEHCYRTRRPPSDFVYRLPESVRPELIPHRF
jgi:hypothetical protein